LYSIFFGRNKLRLQKICAYQSD